MTAVSGVAFYGGGASAAKSDLTSVVAGFVAAFNGQKWTPTSFFDGPRVNAPDIVVFGQGKTYDFFA